MEYYNKMNIEMTNNAAAQKAFEIVKEVLANGNYDTDYRCEPSIKLMEAITINKNFLLLSGDDGFYTPEDMRNVAADVFTAIATDSKNEFVSGSVFTDSTYSDSEVTAIVDSDKVIISTVYYPMGFVESLVCDDCGEEIVGLQDFDPNKEYVCPECGEALDLQSQYDEVIPQTTEKIITF